MFLFLEMFSLNSFLYFFYGYHSRLCLQYSAIYIFKICMINSHNTFYFYLSSEFLQYILYLPTLLTTSCIQCFEWLWSAQIIRKQWCTQCLSHFWSDLFSVAVLTNVWFISLWFTFHSLEDWPCSLFHKYQTYIQTLRFFSPIESWTVQWTSRDLPINTKGYSNMPRLTAGILPFPFNPLSPHS